MSIVYAPLELPPICRMRPGRYIAVLDSQPPLIAVLKLPARVNVPAPVVLTQYICPLPGS